VCHVPQGSANDQRDRRAAPLVQDDLQQNPREVASSPTAYSAVALGRDHAAILDDKSPPPQEDGSGAGGGANVASPLELRSGGADAGKESPGASTLTASCGGCGGSSMGGGSPDNVRSGDTAASGASSILQHNDADMQDAGGQNEGEGGGIGTQNRTSAYGGSGGEAPLREGAGWEERRGGGGRGVGAGGREEGGGVDGGGGGASGGGERGSVFLDWRSIRLRNATKELDICGNHITAEDLKSRIHEIQPHLHTDDVQQLVLSTSSGERAQLFHKGETVTVEILSSAENSVANLAAQTEQELEVVYERNSQKSVFYYIYSM
jgi:hypothetical protein